MDDRARRGRPSPSDVALGLGVIALAGALAWQVAAIPATPLYARVGPSVFPTLIVIMIGLLGGGLTVQGLTGGWAHDAEAGAADPAGAAWMVAGLAANLALIDGMTLGPVAIPKLGFVLAASAQFVLTARAFGSRRPLRDGAVGLLIALLAFLGFDRLLGLQIGSGVIEDAARALLEPWGV